MRSILSPRLLAVVGIIAVAMAGSAMIDRSPPSEVEPVPSLQEAARRTIAAGSARISGTVSAADGTAVTFEGVTSFRTSEGDLRARTAGAGGDGEASIEVRTTGAGTWLRTPGVDRWIAVPRHAAAGGLPTGWGEVLRRLSRSTDASRRTDFDVDGRGRIRWMRFSEAGAGVEVAFGDFGVAVTVEPPPGATP